MDGRQLSISVLAEAQTAAMADSRSLRNSISLFGKSSGKLRVSVIYLVWFVLIYPVLASHEKATLIEVSKLEKTTQKRLTAGGQSSGTTQTNDVKFRFRGKLIGIGRENNVDGRLHLVTTVPLSSS